MLGELSPGEPGEMWGTVDHGSRTRHSKHAIRERLSEAKYETVEIEIAFGDPARKISEFAQQIGAELIVMPSHGRSAISRLLMGLSLNARFGWHTAQS